MLHLKKKMIKKKQKKMTLKLIKCLVGKQSLKNALTRIICFSSALIQDLKSKLKLIKLLNKWQVVASYIAVDMKSKFNKYYKYC